MLEIATDFYTNLYCSPQYCSTESTIDYSDIKSGIQQLEIPPFLTSEIRHAIQNLKSVKSPGEDGITNYVLKAIIEPITPILTDLFNRILDIGVIPHEWENSIITLLFKKGDHSDIGNYRPISLLQTTYKVFTSIILKRLRYPLEQHQPREQAGFRARYSTMDHIFTLTQVIERYTEYNKQLYIAFIDYSKAFDSIHHISLWMAL